MIADEYRHQIELLEQRIEQLRKKRQTKANKAVIACLEDMLIDTYIGYEIARRLNTDNE